MAGLSLKQSYSFSRLTLALIVCSGFLLIWYFRWSDNLYQYAVNGDGADYYSYLISIFIDHNLGHQDISRWFVIPTETGTINVHTVGVSLLLLPFFGLGYLWALIGDADLNGMSEPFMKMVCLGALFYLSIGLYFLKRFLKEFEFSDKIIALTLLLIFFGTNLLNYTVNEPSMCHVYSFSLISIFLFYAKRIVSGFSAKDLYIISVVFGLILLVRPVNGIVIFIIPFLAGSFEQFKNVLSQIFSQKKNIVIALLIFFIVIFIQPAIWLVQNGQFIQWSYKGNGFYFTDPHTLLMLCGFDSGFFIYTPLCFIALFGFVPMFRQNKFLAIGLSLFLVFTFYLFSCYWGWTYFDGLGIRTFVDFYAIFALLIAVLLKSLSSARIRLAAFAMIGCTSLLSLIFCFQYYIGILPPAGMNFNKFKYIFLNTDESYVGVLGGSMDLEPYKEAEPEKIFSYSQTKEYIFNENEFGLEYKINPVNISSNKLYVKISLKRKEEALNSSGKAMVIVHVEEATGKSKSYSACLLNEVPADKCCEWLQQDYRFTIADKITPTDRLSVYVWNKEKQSFSISDFNVEVYNYNFKTS